MNPGRPTLPPQIELPDDTAIPVERWRAIATFLWERLDDIDTVSDVACGDDRAYRAMVERLQARRHEVGVTDGYRLRFRP